MGRKGKTQKHTAAETAAKHKAAKEARGGAGGGGTGAENRKSVGNKNSVKCVECLGIQPNIKSMELHYDNKHSKINFNDKRELYEGQFIEAKNNK